MPSPKTAPIAEWQDFRYEIVPLDKLFVDKDYQRRLTGIVKEIRNEFIPPLIQTLCVSARKETGSGKDRRVTMGAVFDGQNRLVGAREHNEALDAGEEVIGPRCEVVPCIVYSGLSQAQEAQLFVWIQTRRRNAMSYDRFYAALMTQGPEGEEARTIKDIVEDAGYEVGYTGMSDRTISAVSALEQMYRRDILSMERTLIIFKAAWKDRHLPQAPHLRGLARFLRDNPDIDDERMVRRLSINTPTDLEKKELNARELSPTGKRSDATMAAAIQSIYSMRENQVEAALRRQAA